MGKNEGFMDNEKLYNMIENLSDKLNKFYIELQETRSDIQKYNGLRKDIAENTKNINDIESSVNKNSQKINRIESKEKGEENQREKIYWVVIILLSLVNILSLLGVV